jgi:hypothetical protein
MELTAIGKKPSILLIVFAPIIPTADEDVQICIRKNSINQTATISSLADSYYSHYPGNGRKLESAIIKYDLENPFRISGFPILTDANNFHSFSCAIDIMFLEEGWEHEK